MIHNFHNQHLIGQHLLLLPRLHHVASDYYDLVEQPLILKGLCDDVNHSQDANDVVVDHTIFNRELPCSHHKKAY